MNNTLTWTTMRWTTKAERDFTFVGDNEQLCGKLEDLGYEVESMTDQVDAYRRDRSGRRRLRMTLMP